MLACHRERFAIPDSIAYLNSAYMGPLSDVVVAAGREGLERKMRPWTITAPDFFAQVEAVRTLFAQVIGADADGVAVLPAVSYGVAIAARNLPVARDSRIVLLAEQFPSNVYAWHALAEQERCEIVTVERPPDHDWTRAVLDAIDERTSVVSVETCHWTDGGLLDLVKIGERVREVDAAFVVDATQSIGAISFDVALVRPDFLITAVYKWLLAPYGAAVLWCAEEHRHGAPLELSWITRDRSEEFAHLVDYRSEFRQGARRYDVGQTSNFAMIPAIEAALKQTLGWGVPEIQSYAGRLISRVADGATALGLEVAPSALRAPHIVGVHLGEADPEGVASALADAQVFVSVRGRAIRVSAHVFNNDADVDRLLEALGSAL